MANELKYGIRITADGSVAVTEAGKAEQALKRIGDQAKLSSIAVSRFGVAIGAAAAAGTASFLALMKQSTSAAAALDDLSESTGSSVENLSALQNSMAVSGVDAGTFAGLMNKLAVGLSGVDDEGGKAGKALAALGVQSKDPAAAMKELAASLDQYADGANKAALLTAIFGRGAAQHAGALKDLARDTELAASVTTDFAAEAEKLEKMLARTNVTVQGVATAIASELVSALNGAIDDLERGTAAAGGFWAALLAFGLTNPFKDIATRQAELRDELEQTNAKFLQLATDGAGEGTLGVVEDRIRKIRMELEQLNRQELRNLSMLTGAGTYDARDLALQNMNRRPDAPTVSADHTTKVKKAADTWSEMAAAIKRAHDNAMNWVLAGEEIEQQINAIAAAYAGDYKREYEEYQQQLDKSQEAVRALVVDLEQEVDMLGQSNSQRRLSIALLQLEASGIDRTSEEYAELEARIRAAIGAEEAHAAAESWGQTAASIRDDLTDALLNAALSGRDVFKNLASSLVNMFSNLVLRPIVQGVMAPVAGGITGMLGSGNAAASGLGGIGNLFGGGSSLLGYGGVGGLLSGAGGIFGAGAIGNSFALGGMGQALGLSAAGLDAAGGVALTTLGTTLGAAIPVIGAALAVAAMFGAFSSKGGPKQAGTAGYGGFYPGETSATGNSAVQTIVTATEASYKQLLSGLGGKGSAAFTLGYDTDPEGDAESRVSAGAMVNGQSVYSLRDLDVGRDEESLTAALETESKRALLAALQASDLPAQIAAVFNTLAVESASSADIDNLLSFGAAMQTVIEAVGGDVMLDAQKDWEKSQRSTLDVLRDMGAEVVKLSKGMDGSLESMQALATATGNFRSAVAQTLLAIQQMAAQVADMFAQTTASIVTFGMSPEELYAYYAADYNNAAQELATTKDPERAQALAARLNDDINAAWAALPEVQKLAMRPAFLQWISQSGELSAGAFERTGAAVENLTVDPFAAANASLDGAAAKFSAAANTQATAADNNLRASENNLTASNNNLAASRTPVVVQLVSGLAEVGG